MNKTARIVQIISFVIMGYLFYSIGSSVDVAPTKNNHLLTFEKNEIDRMDNLDKVKKKAKELREINRRVVIAKDKEASRQLWLLLVLIFAQGYLFFTRPK